MAPPDSTLAAVMTPNTEAPSALSSLWNTQSDTYRETTVLNSAAISTAIKKIYVKDDIKKRFSSSVMSALSIANFKNKINTATITEGPTAVIVA